MRGNSVALTPPRVVASNDPQQFMGALLFPLAAIEALRSAVAVAQFA